MQIVINKRYFDNIKIAIDAMNNFFASGFKTKSFPVVNNDFQLDRILSRTLSWLNNIEPSWVDDPNKAVETLDTLKQIVTKQATAETTVTESSQFIQEFTLLELIATCGAIAVASSVTHALIQRHNDKKAIKNQTYEKEMFDQLKNVTRLIESTKDFAIMKSDWNFDGPNDDDDGEGYYSDKEREWFDDQLDFEYHCDRIVAELAQLGECLKKCEIKKTALYHVIPKETREFTNFIWELIDSFTIVKIDYGKQRFYKADDINPVKAACDEFESKTKEFVERFKQVFSNIVNEAVEEVPAEPDNPWVKIISGEDKTASDMFHAFIGFKVLQYITNNFDKYEQLLNGIYSFELFTKPSAYRDAITVFTSPIPMPELNSIAKLPGEYKLFDASDYVNSIFANEQIKLPEDMNSDTEIQRFQSFGDLQDCEIVINDAVQEAAKVDYFTDTVEGIRFSKGRWQISKQFESSINDLLKRLRECDTTEDLAELFQTAKINPMAFRNAVVPAILVRVFSNPKKVAETDKDEFKDYTKSYSSITRQNEGAKRFARIDLFSTFKTDKEGTIQFLEDFFKLNLVNNENAIISNNTILTTFNIFDSHIYFTILYNVMDDKQREAETCDSFIKRIRSRINKNSHAVNPYQKKKEVKQTIEGSAQVTEYALETLKELGDLSIADMRYCESFAGAVYDEISALGDLLYNKGVSQIMIDQYIGESYDLFPGTGDVYMEWSKRQSAILAGWVIGALIGGPGVVMARGALTGFGGTLLELLMTKRIGSIAGGMIASHYYRKNRLAKDTIEYICNIIDLLKSESKNCESEVKRLKKLCKSLKDSCKVLSHDKDVMSSDQTCFADMVVVCKRVIEDLKVGGNNAKLMEDFLERLFKIREILTGEKTSDLINKDKTVQEAAETGTIPNYLKERVNLSDEPIKKKEDDSKKKESSSTPDIKLDPDDDFEPEVPEYMKNRMNDAGEVDTSITDIQLPPDVPTNDPEQLADSIEARLSTDANSLGDMLGADYKGQIKPASQGGPGTVIYNITNNYSNSHNKTVTNDLSNRSHTSTITSNDLSSNKRTNSAARTRATNNYDNTRPSSNSKESDDTFSTGKSVQEVFALLNSEEPLFVESVSGEPPKGDMLTAAMDVDRATLPAQQKAKRGVQKVVNTGKAIVKPIGRTKQWVRSFVDSLIKRDEDRVKADLIENPSYRSALYKVARLAIKTGAAALFFSVSPWLGVGYLGIQGAKLVDRDRLRKEANQEIATEIQILDEKIEHLKSGSRWGNEQTEEQRQELYKLMRMRQKLVQLSTNARKQNLANPKSVY